MSNDEEQNRGASIIPKGRKSIHNHRHYCPFASDPNMVRYGLDKECNQEDNSAGHDEVDNIWSKPIRHQSPSPIKKTYRRNSSNEILYEDSENSDNELAKSLPETLPSHLYCSESINKSIERSRGSTSRDKGRLRTPQSQQILGNISGRSRSFDTSSSSDITAYNYSEKQGNNTSSQIFLYSVILIAVVITYFTNIVDFFGNKIKISYIYDERNLTKDLDIIQEKYNLDEDSMLKLRIGLTTISQKKIAGSFIFVYNSNSREFNQEKFEEYIDSIALTSARYLRNSTAEVHHLAIDSKNLNMKAHQDFINKYRDEVSRTGVMLLKSMSDLPSNLAMAFHYYCDEYEPLVQKSAVFFTLDLQVCASFSGSKSILEMLEKCLANKWTSVDKDKIGPLLTRVVSVVIDVAST